MPDQVTQTAVETAEQVRIWFAPAVAYSLIAALVVLAVATLVLVVLLCRKKKQPTLLACPQIGKVHEQGAREYQEDCFAVSEISAAGTQGVLAVVSDGMGGLEDGAQVSETAVSAAINGFYEMKGDADNILLALLTQANQEVNNLLGPDRLNKSGATFVMGLLREERFHYLSVGDSRICLYRDGQLIQLNRDHVFRNDLLVRVVNRETTFQEAIGHPKAAGLTGYLGQGQLKHVDLPAHPVAVRPGDKFILMSDGVYNALTREELTAALEKGAEEAAEAIRDAVQAKEYANQDNFTAVILAC